MKETWFTNFMSKILADAHIKAKLVLF
jgi:hypothetical protein